MYSKSQDDVKFTKEYADEQICEFREAMGLRTTGLRKLDKMFAGLFLVMVRVGEVTPGWESLCVEWPMRRGLMLTYNVGVGSDYDSLDSPFGAHKSREGYV